MYYSNLETNNYPALYQLPNWDPHLKYKTVFILKVIEISMAAASLPFSSNYSINLRDSYDDAIIWQSRRARMHILFLAGTSKMEGYSPREGEDAFRGMKSRY